MARHGVRVRVTCSEACRASLSLVSRATGRRAGALTPVTYASGRARLRRRGRLTVTLRLTRRSRRLLGRARSTRVALLASGRDAAGNRARPVVHVLTLR